MVHQTMQIALIYIIIIDIYYVIFKTGVKASNRLFQGNGDNDQPPPENPKFDSCQSKSGLNPFIDKFDYDNPNYT